MPFFNRTIVMGNITRDLDLRYTNGGTAVLEVGLAVNERHRNQNGEMNESTMFIDCVCFGRIAEIVNEYLEKGSPVLFEGRLKQDRWEKDGQSRSKHKIVVETMRMIGDARSQSSDSGNVPRDDSQQVSYQPRNQYASDDYDSAAPF